MSRIATSVASFSWQRAAIRRAVSSGVSLRASFRRLRSPQCSPAREPIEPAALDLGRHAGGTRPSSGSPRATRSRISEDETGNGSSGKNSTRSGWARLREHVVEHVPRIAGPRGDAEPRQLEHALRPLPVEKRCELVGADEEDRIVEPERLERVDRPRERVESDLGAGDGGERDLASARAGRSRSPPRACARVLDDAHEQAVGPEVVDRSEGERDVPVVRRIERAAEDARMPASTPIRAPRRRSRPAHPNGPPQREAPPLAPRRRGACPTTRKPPSVRRIRKRGLRGRGRYSRNSGSTGVSGARAAAPQDRERTATA